MTTLDLAAIAASLATIFEDRITSQINRSTVLLQALPVGDGEGKNLAWNARFGSDVGVSRADGADLVAGDFKVDTKVPATLEYGTYDAPFSLTGKALAGAYASGNPSDLENLFGEEMQNAVERLAKGIHQALISGAGGTDEIHGLFGASGPLDTTGTYAGISRATYPQWASNELANGGVPRALTFDLMREAVEQIYTASGENVDMIVTTPALWTKFGKLFNGERRQMTDVYMRGNKIVLSGGFSALEFDGVPVMRDVDMPAGKMAFLTSRHLKVCQMPDPANAVNQASGNVGLAGSPEADMGEPARKLTARVNPLGRAGDSFKFQLICYPQLKCRKPNAQGSIVDLDATL